ncbi:kynurenine 3-monooxygenase [Brumimicrobium salinarum]|uniref:Kynurenine 3-monooxygenase n=1 Tax=Brumimicrobium salinarum TaxID=2058658 RepID=A0A2I0R5T8_9FLAO|nr:NAD(P)/FAD-dependent oxidoreductase [Brumimicrobium salinarum]PKR81943.1 kynurenine 3-monooxygenase [Brumimicrobium salinarum]
MEEKNVAVVGAGLVGSLLAVLLAKKGMNVDVFERRPDLRKAKAIGGRSINLALSNRGFKALELAGFADEIKSIAIPMYGRKMHDIEGNLTYQPYGKEDEAIYSVSRGQLNQKLMNLADDYKNIRYRFDHACEGIELDKNEIHFKNTSTNSLEKYNYQQIFGTDGAFSAVRGSLQKTPMFNYAQEYLPHGYKELHFPANEDGTHCFDKNCLHIWPRGEFMLIALPNLDGSFTVTLFFPMKGETSFESLDTEEKVVDFFEKTFPDTLPYLPNLTKDFFENPTSTLVTIRCNPWNFEDKVLLLGDASHAVVPFYGQGLNAGMEDCTILMDLMENYKGKPEDFLATYSEKRVADGNAIADLALYNYIEMRDLAGDEDFLLRKKIERKFSDMYPNKWMPLYSQVTFSHIPYSEALAAGNKQRKIMDEVMKMEDIHDVWDEPKVIEKILSLVE